MAEKNMVIKITSDAKQFASNFIESIKTINNAVENVKGFEKLTGDLSKLKKDVEIVSNEISKAHKDAENGSSATDQQLMALNSKVESMAKRFDSFRHTFGDMQDELNNLKTETLSKQVEKAIAGLDAFREKYSSLQQLMSIGLSGNKDLAQISNIEELKQAYEDAYNVFSKFAETAKTNKDGSYSKEYLKAAANVSRYANALIELNGAYNTVNKKNAFTQDVRNKFDTSAIEAKKVLGEQFTKQIQNEVQSTIQNIDINSFFKNMVGQVDVENLMGVFKEGTITIPVKLDPKRYNELVEQIKSDVNSLQEIASENPIQINYGTDTTKIAENIDKYFSKLKTELNNQVTELNNIMNQLISDTGLKKTEENFSSISQAFPNTVLKISEYSGELKKVAIDINTVFENINNIAKEDSFKIYAEAVTKTADSFKELLSALDNVSSKISGNGLEGQFEILRKNFSNIDLTALIGETKDVNIIKEKKKELRELFSLYSVYQSRGGIRPISDLLVGETDENKTTYFNNAYKEYVRKYKKKKNKTDIGDDFFIPEGILKTDKKQLDNILSVLKEINDVLQKINKIDFSSSDKLKNVMGIIGDAKSESNKNPTASIKKPVIPSKKKEDIKGEEQVIQNQQTSQTKQTAQEIVDSNQTVIDSNKKLANNIQDTAQVVQQEKEATKGISNELKEKKINSLMYHLGNINGQSQRLTHPFGDEIKSWFTGIRSSGRGNGDGTGLYVTKNIEEFSKTPISDKDLKKYYAIDTSDLKLYEAHTEETAQDFYNFIHHLEQLCISLGSGFKGFDDNLKNIDAETLYKTAQSIFPEFKMTFEQFDDFITNMTELVSKSGIKADGSIASMKMLNFKKEYGVDDIKTRFLKLLGYQGTDLSGTSFGGIQSGNVIFDTVDTKRIVASGKQIDEVSQQAKNNISGLKEEIKETVELSNELTNNIQEATQSLQQLEKGKTGSRIESDLKEKIAEAERRINEIRNKPLSERHFLKSQIENSISESNNKKDNQQQIQKSTPNAPKKAPDVPNILKNNQQQIQQLQQVQQVAQQTGNTIDDSEQNILNLITNIQTSLQGLREDLKILAEMIIVIAGATEQKDYIGQIEAIKNGVIALNVLILELGNNIKSIDLSKISFDKINKLEFSTTPFDNIANSLKEIIDLIERVTGATSKSNLKSQFDYIQTLYNSMVNDNGTFIARGNKGKLQLMYSLYDEYKKGGGQMSLHRLTGSRSNQEKLYRQYGYYQSRIKSEDTINNSTNGVNSIEQLKLENEALKESAKVLLEALQNKQKYSEATKNVAESVKSSAKEIENENQKIKESNNETKKSTTKAKKVKNKKEEQSSSDFILVGEPYGDNVSYKKSEKNTSMIPTNGFTMVGDSQVEDVIHTQVRVKKAVEETTTEIERQQTALETVPNIEVWEGEVEGAEKALANIYKQELQKFREGTKSYEEAYRSMEEEFAKWYASQGYNHTKSVFNVTPDFELKSANITRENPEEKKTIIDTFKRFVDKDTEESRIEHTNIQMIDNEEKRIISFTKELERNEKERNKLTQWIASFHNKTSDNFKDTNQIIELNRLANDATLINDESLRKAEILKGELETVYNNVVNNARRGSSSLSPIPNMMFGEESRLTKLEKAQSTYAKMAVDWNSEDMTKNLMNTERELKNLRIYYDALRDSIERYNTVDENDKRVGNIVEVSNAYGTYNEQLNRVTEQLNRIKTINTEINGNKINNLNQWFRDIDNPNEKGAANLGKIEKYTEIYNQFYEAQQKLKGLTTNLTMGTDEESTQKYEETKQEIHEIILELENFKKILSSDSMNINNQTGQIIKQNLPETNDIENLKTIINEYVDTIGRIQDSSSTGIITDKEGNQFVKFTRIVQNTKGAVSELEFTYDKAMGTIAVATKKVQEPESLLKTITDELNTKWRGLFTTLLSFTGFYRLWGYFKQGINTVREFDTALTEMQKVSDNSIQTLQEYQKTTFDTADAIGATALQIQNSTADFMRLGESLKEAAESAKVANILMNVSEFESINEATKSLIAMGAAYKDLDKMTIIDKLNEVGNNYAISTSEAATALQSSASALKTAKNDMDESLALITAGNAVVQDANKVGIKDAQR